MKALTQPTLKALQALGGRTNTDFPALQPLCSAAFSTLYLTFY